MVEVLHRECGRDADVAVVDEQVQLKLDELRPILKRLSDTTAARVPGGEFGRLKMAAQRLVEALDAARTQTMQCPFEGDVEARMSGPTGDVALRWTCPLCGHEHEELD